MNYFSRQNKKETSQGFYHKKIRYEKIFFSQNAESPIDFFAQNSLRFGRRSEARRANEI